MYVLLFHIVQLRINNGRSTFRCTCPSGEKRDTARKKHVFLAFILWRLIVQQGRLIGVYLRGAGTWNHLPEHGTLVDTAHCVASQ